MMIAVEDLESPSVWDVPKAIELLRTLRSNRQELGPTSEKYLAGRKLDQPENSRWKTTDCRNCRTYSARGLRYVQWEDDEVIGVSGILE
jgi:hypothetical protein